MTPEPARVTRVVRETFDVFTLVLEPPEPKKGFHFRPGQFNMLYVFGAGEVPISLSGDPDANDHFVHTIRAVGTVTERLKKTKRGEMLGVRGPFGTGWPCEDARGRDVLIVAGGVGLAPLRSMIYYVLRNRAEFARVAFLYGAKRPEDLIFVKELEKWRGRFDVGVRVTVDTAGPTWRGEVGPITNLVRAAYFDPDDAVALVCGPEVMMRIVARDLRDRGLPAGRIFLSMERNMQCAVGHCGHCQFGPHFVCKDGPVFSLDRIEPLLYVREV